MIHPYAKDRFEAARQCSILHPKTNRRQPLALGFQLEFTFNTWTTHEL
jgi:hypothetical protein